MRLVVYPNRCLGEVWFYTSQVVVWDFWSINSTISTCTLTNPRLRFPPTSPRWSTSNVVDQLLLLVHRDSIRRPLLTDYQPPSSPNNPWPSWKLTYPLRLRHVWADDLPLPKDMLVPRRVIRPYMDVSENSGTPKSSILIGFSIV